MSLLGSEEESIKWRPNDGLVSFISARSDASGYVDYPVNMFASASQVSESSQAVKKIPTRGIFHFTGMLPKTDHLRIIGLFDEDEPKNYRNSLFFNAAGLLSSLPE